jgi:hypothetical protein
MRSTCLYCEQKGIETQLVQTIRGGICPSCSGDFLEKLEANARAVLGIQKPKLLGKGVPKPRRDFGQNDKAA